MEEALALARGSYQRALILGNETWSGSSLKGRARSWASKYQRSRSALLQRLTDAGVAYLIIRENGKIELELGRPPGHCVKSRVNCGTAWIPNPTVLDEIVEAL